MANVGNGNAGEVLTGNSRTSGPNFEPLGTRSNLQNHGVVVAQGNAAFVAIDPGIAGQVLTSNGNAVDPSFQNASGGLLPWSDAVSSKVMVSNNGYIVSAAAVTLTIPPTVTEGSVFRVVGNGNTWAIAQSPGQTIHLGNSTTAGGVLGSLQATGNYDAIEILCIIANTVFAVINGPQGNITVN